MSNSLGDKVEKGMQSAGVKARTFAALVGCHYSTIYDLLKNRESVVPLRLIQEKIYDVLDFIDASVQAETLPLDNKLTLSKKTTEIERLYKSYSEAKQK